MRGQIIGRLPTDLSIPMKNTRGMFRDRNDAALTADGEYGSCAADVYVR
jgi:hypothetical protein